jgi:hypothetical protein
VVERRRLDCRVWDYGLGADALSDFSGAMNFRAIVKPTRIICNWFVWN